MEIRGQLHAHAASIPVHGTHTAQNSEDKNLEAYVNN
jgi:hypothetical protein